MAVGILKYMEEGGRKWMGEE